MTRDTLICLLLLPFLPFICALRGLVFGFWIVAWVLKDDGSKELFQ